MRESVNRPGWAPNGVMEGWNQRRADKITAWLQPEDREMNRAHRRRFREGMAAKARAHNMRTLTKDILQERRGLTFSGNGSDGVFCWMPVRPITPAHWTCGAIEVDGYWVGGSRRLADAARVLMS